MTPQQAIDNIAIYSALHNGVLDSSVKVLDKSVKALEIIKNKKVDVSYLYKEIDLDVKDNTQLALTRYNSTVQSKDELTQEEFDSLKEAFSNDKR